MEAIKKDSNYIEARQNQNEGMSQITPSCIKCKFKADYSQAIPYLRTAADMYFGFSKSKPDLYKQFLVWEEIKCREKLIVCLDKERSLIEAGEQGIKLAKLYINYNKSFDLAYKTMENFNLSFIQTGSLGNNAVQKSLKGMSEVAKCFSEQGANDFADKTYYNLFDTAINLFPGQVKENEPYEFIYNAFFDYFENLIIKKEFEQMLSDVLKLIEVVSPSKEQILQRENVLGKENNIDNILPIYYKLLISCICMEDPIKFDTYWKNANEIKSDSTHEIILDGLRDIYEACLNGDEKNFNKNLTFLDSVLRISEIREFRSIMKKYKINQPEDLKKSPEAESKENINWKNNNFYREKENSRIFRKSDKNFEEKNYETKIELQNINKEMQNINKDIDTNLQKLNELHDFGQEFKKLTNTSSDLIHRQTEEISQIQQSAIERQKKYQIKEEEEEENEKDHIVNLDKQKNIQENLIPSHDYL